MHIRQMIAAISVAAATALAAPAVLVAAAPPAAAHLHAPVADPGVFYHG